MRKMLFLTAMALLAISLPCEAQKFLDIYKNGNVVSSLKAADVDRMVVDESTNNKYVYFYHDGKVFHHTETANVDSVMVYDLSKAPLTYLGIVGFSQELFEKSFGMLDKNKAGDYKSFVSGLTRKDGTLLYYAVDHALDMLQNQSFPSQVGSVNLITFTDGLDQGSLMMNGNYSTDQQYLDAVSQRISEMRVKGLPLTAYSLGLRGSDVTDYQQFQSNLEKIASSADKAFEVSNMSDARERLQNISDQIVSISNTQTSVTHYGTVVMLVLDCSSSLDSQFSEMKSCANDFIDRVANSAAEDVERPFGCHEFKGSYLNCPDDNHPHLIDLGLPSGTKWACCNVGADKPEAYGGYYAWGETEEKSTYNNETYQYYNGFWQNLGSGISGTEYDVAQEKWKGPWVMPSREQQFELVNNCTSTWTTQNGVRGKLFTGANGGSIFLPAAGRRRDSSLVNADSGGYYWSSTHYMYENKAFGLYFGPYLGSDTTTTFYIGNRSDGHSVRPVSNLNN